MRTAATPTRIGEVLFRVDNVLVSIAHGHVNYVTLLVAKTYALELYDHDRRESRPSDDRLLRRWSAGRRRP